MTPIFWTCIYLVIGILIAEIGVHNIKKEELNPATYPTALLLWPVAIVLAVIIARRNKP